MKIFQKGSSNNTIMIDLVTQCIAKKIFITKD